jgi:hypothetical protein
MKGEDGEAAWRTRDGAEWEPLGGYSQVMAAYGTAGGAVLLSVRDAEGTAEVRIADGESERRAVISPYLYRERPSGGLLRLNQGIVDASDDDGLTWTPVVTELPNPTVVGGVALDDVVLGETTIGLARLEAGASQWKLLAPPPLPNATTARFRDIAFSRTGVLAVAGEHQVFVSEDGGLFWRYGYRFADTFPIHAIAFRPDGGSIFVGSTLGRYAVLDGGGAEVLGEDSIDDAIGSEPPRETIRQAYWVGSETTPVRQMYVVLTTASEDNVRGQVWHAVLDDPQASWTRVNPFDEEAIPNQQRQAGYYGIAVNDQGRGGGESWWVGARQFISAGSSLDHLRLRFGEAWTDGVNPVAFGQPLTISASGEYGQAMALLFSESRLYVGAFTHTFLQANLVGASGDILSAKFAPEGQLWLVTSQGLFRSKQIYGEP